MKRLLPLLVLIALTACEAPQPPPELRALTPTPARLTPLPTAPPAPPTATLPPSGGGTIWFLRGGQLWSAGPDGLDPRRRSSRPATSPPAPAPDGRLVAYLSGRRLLLLDATTGAERVLAEGDMAARQTPSWSPDGTRIAYFTNPATYDAENYALEPVWAVPADGSGPPQQLAVSRVRGERVGPSFRRTARWSSDGRRFAVCSLYGPTQVIPLTGSAGAPFTVNGGEPDWDPSGRYLLYSQTLNGGLAIYDAVSVEPTPFANEKRLVGTGLGGENSGAGPLFSPDGQSILYRSRTSDGQPAVAVRARAGNEGLFLPGNNPAWSPDGSWIIYETGTVSQTMRGPDWQPDGLGKVRADGSNMAQLLQDAQSPAWGR